MFLELLVMILITPFMAFAPHTVPPGPRITSMRSIFSSGTSCAYHSTPENAGWYTLRPSIRTSTLLAYTLLNPRMLMAQLLWSIRATFTPGAIRRRSGILVAPERRMSSWLITKIAAPVFASFCSFLETDVTWTFIRSSRLNWVRSRGDLGGLEIATPPPSTRMINRRNAAPYGGLDIKRLSVHLRQDPKIFGALPDAALWRGLR